ncbi:MAG: PEP-CTERM sorting domain-containing protein [Planctomycetota bacterium]|jgi:hypothetical protein
MQFRYWIIAFIILITPSLNYGQNVYIDVVEHYTQSSVFSQHFCPDPFITIDLLLTSDVPLLVVQYNLTVLGDWPNTDDHWILDSPTPSNPWTNGEVFTEDEYFGYIGDQGDGQLLSTINQQHPPESYIKQNGMTDTPLYKARLATYELLCIKNYDHPQYVFDIDPVGLFDNGYVYELDGNTYVGDFLPGTPLRIVHNVPEPTSLLLFIFASLAMLRKKR